MQGSQESGREISDDELLARCREGDADAQQLLYDRFSSRLIAIAQRRIGARLGRRLDSEDVIQSVFRTFFRKASLGKYPPEESEKLWGQLVRVTLSKTIDATREHTAEKRDIHLEVPGDWSQPLVDTFGRGPSPDQAAVLTELLDQLLCFLGDAKYMSIIELTLQGHDKVEIAEQVRLSKRSVDRTLNRAKAFLEMSLGSDDDSVANVVS